MKKALNQVSSAGHAVDCLLRKIISFAHKNCNINLRWTKKILVTFHNVRGYDSHMILQEIGKSD